jgi:hypothetical protein
MSLMSRLRAAARSAAEATIEFGGGDPAELVALAERIGAREDRSAECAVLPGSPGVLVVRFTGPVRPSP